MDWKKWFSKGKKKGPDPIRDICLSKMEVGWFVDYDLKTWEVTGRHHYDWGEGDLTYEWQLRSADDLIYLEMETDDETFWSISRKVPLARIDAGIGDHILAHGDPPEEITVEGETFYLDESGGGHFHKRDDGNGDTEGKPFLKWDYINEAEDRQISIEQWGEKAFEASMGEQVEEYQFTNILPIEEPS